MFSRAMNKARTGAVKNVSNSITTVAKYTISAASNRSCAMFNKWFITHGPMAHKIIVSATPIRI